MAITKTEVWARHEFVSFHCWREAPPELHYLSVSHRHLFKVEVCVSVDHANRDVEFHTLKTHLTRICRTLEYPQDNPMPMSCERMAQHIGGGILACGVPKPTFKVTQVTVSEDGECGATIYVD